MRRRKDYIINEYNIKGLGKNRKKHISIAILEKESQAIARNNELESNIQQYSRISGKVMYATIDQTRKTKANHRRHFARVK